jgi:hypothetical protein
MRKGSLIGKSLYQMWNQKSYLPKYEKGHDQKYPLRLKEEQEQGVHLRVPKEVQGHANEDSLRPGVLKEDQEHAEEATIGQIKRQEDYLKENTRRRSRHERERKIRPGRTPLTRGPYQMRGGKWHKMPAI